MIGETVFKERFPMLSNDQFTSYAERYIDMVYRVALHYLKSAEYAEDVTQNVFVKLLQYRSIGVQGVQTRLKRNVRFESK